ncbi:MAG: NADH-quinone oxidoreductase subunit A [Casimicrobiaceae bacterium]
MTQQAPLWPLLMYALIVLVLMILVLIATRVLGELHRAPGADLPFESGIVSVGDARLRLSAKFYLVAMFFVIFDVEALFIFAWAIAWRDVGWAGYAELVIFVAILLAGLAYLWRLGGLDWGSGSPIRRISSNDATHRAMAGIALPD